MTLFEMVKERISVKQAAWRYGLEPNSSGMACCPFHDDRHPSLKLNETYYYCFGCGAHGDVIDLVSHLLHLDACGAARKLAEDFGIDTGLAARQGVKKGRNDAPDAAGLYEGHGGPESCKNKAVQLDKWAEKREYECLKVLLDYLDVLKGWRKTYAPVRRFAEPDERYVEACRMTDQVEALCDMILYGSKETRSGVVSRLMDSGNIDALEGRLRRLKANEAPGVYAPRETRDTAEIRKTKEPETDDHGSRTAGIGSPIGKEGHHDKRSMDRTARRAAVADR